MLERARSEAVAGWAFPSNTSAMECSDIHYTRSGDVALAYQVIGDGHAEVRARLVAQGAEVVTMTPPEFTQFFNTERARWSKVVAEAGVRLD